MSRPQHPLAPQVETLAMAGFSASKIAKTLGLMQDTVRTILRRLGFHRVERWEK